MWSLNPVTGKRRKTLIYGIDGLQGNVLQKCLKKMELKGFEKLIKFGTGKTNAKTHSGRIIDLSATLATAPGWTSVLTGIEPMQHRMIKGSEEYGLERQESGYDSFLKTAKELGLNTAAIGTSGVLARRDGSDKYENAVDSEMNSVPGKNYPNGDNINTDVLTHRYYLPAMYPLDCAIFSSMIHAIEKDSDIVFCVFNDQDSAGHSSGYKFKSKRYVDTIKRNDGYLERTINYLERRTIQHNEEWLVILTSDHGGHSELMKGIPFCWGNRGSHTFYPADRVVPYLMMVITTQGYDIDYPPLNKMPDKVTHMETFSCVSHWMGLEVNDHIYGLNNEPEGKIKKITN